MKQPTDQQERNEDKKKPEKENPSHGIDPESKEPEMEVDQDPAGGRTETRTSKRTIRWRLSFYIPSTERDRYSHDLQRG